MVSPLRIFPRLVDKKVCPFLYLLSKSRLMMRQIVSKNDLIEPSKPLKVVRLEHACLIENR